MKGSFVFRRDPYIPVRDPQETRVGIEGDPCGNKLYREGPEGLPGESTSSARGFRTNLLASWHEKWPSDLFMARASFAGSCVTMAADVPGRREATTSYEGTFAGARLLLSSGAAPISDGADEEIVARFRVAPTALAVARELLEAGPAGAINNIEEFYTLGLPIGLPGQLSVVALNHSEALLDKLRGMAVLRSALTIARKAAAEGRAMQSELRCAGKYDRKRKRVEAAAVDAAADANADAAAAANTVDADADGADHQGAATDDVAASASEFRTGDNVWYRNFFGEWHPSRITEAYNSDDNFMIVYPINSSEQRQTHAARLIPRQPGSAPPRAPAGGGTLSEMEQRHRARLPGHRDVMFFLDEELDDLDEGDDVLGAPEEAAVAATVAAAATSAAATAAAAATSAVAKAAAAAAASAAYCPRGMGVARLPEEAAYAEGATLFIGWLFEHGVSDEAACQAAHVSLDFLHKRHAATGTSRAELLRDQAVIGGKRPMRKRGDRTGLPSVGELQASPCCARSCGLYITPECYAHHWHEFQSAATDAQAMHVLARVAWDVSSGCLVRLCNGRWRSWFGIGSTMVRTVTHAVREAAGGAVEFSHGMKEHRKSTAPPNAIPPDVILDMENFIFERTRDSPEDKTLKAIDPTMSSNTGIYRGFILQGSRMASATFRRHRVKILETHGYKTSIKGYSADHNVCCLCETFNQDLNQLQLNAADERRKGNKEESERLLAERAAEKAKLDAHLQEDADYRRDLHGVIDAAKVLRRHFLADGTFDRACQELPQGIPSEELPSAHRRRVYVPFNSVPAVRIFHIDDKSAAEIPWPKKACVGDDRALFTVQINGQHDCVTDVQINFISHGGGSKDGDKLCDELVANLAQQLQGEMIVIFLFDNCAVGKNDEIATMLPQSFVDRGFCSICEATYFPLYHGKFRADGRFGGYEQLMRERDIFGLDDICMAIEDSCGGHCLDFGQIVDPIHQSNYDQWFANQVCGQPFCSLPLLCLLLTHSILLACAQYTSMTDQNIKFGFTRRHLHHFVAMAPHALEHLSTPALATRRPTGEEVSVPADFFIDRYRPFVKGDGWVGCVGLDMSAPIVFFYMRPVKAVSKKVQAAPTHALIHFPVISSL